jgi:hypothetical protein
MLKKLLVLSFVLLLASSQVCSLTQIALFGADTLTVTAPTMSVTQAYMSLNGTLLAFSNTGSQQVTLSNWGKTDNTVMRAQFTAISNIGADGFTVSTSNTGVVVRSFFGSSYIFYVFSLCLLWIQGQRNQRDCQRCSSFGQWKFQHSDKRVRME